MNSDVNDLRSQIVIVTSQKSNLETSLADSRNQLATANSQGSALQSQIAQANATIAGYRDQVSSLNASVAGLEAEKKELENAIEVLNGEIDTLKAPQLQLVSVYYMGNQTNTVLPYVEIWGAVFNSGTEEASSSIVIVRLYDAFYRVIGGGMVQLGNIAGKTYIEFDEYFTFTGNLSNIELEAAFT